jgi:hypothetical protein
MLERSMIFMAFLARLLTDALVSIFALVCIVILVNLSIGVVKGNVLRVAREATAEAIAAA